jgi:NAD(P)-dependent dehydrogenase (short-subunit alcohol dehydrogenase family)
VLDVTDSASIREAARQVDALTHGHGVDVLVNNAGYGQLGAVLDVSDKEVRQQFDTNVFGLLEVSRAFAPKMIARGSGRILNVSSVGGRITFPMGGIYHASKYAVEALSDALRMELAPFGVHVSLIEPGGIDTGFSATAVGSLPALAASPWAPVYAQTDEVVRRTEAVMPDPTPISAVIAHAATARRPLARYVAPLPYRLLLPLLALLPAWLMDAVSSRMLGLGALYSAPRLTTTAA